MVTYEPWILSCLDPGGKTPLRRASRPQTQSLCLSLLVPPDVGELAPPGVGQKPASVAEHEAEYCAFPCGSELTEPELVPHSEFQAQLVRL
ncbi:hypothetical protein GOODEAATRI_010526 [Goodea atripinnis]|uniref:Uncharacterized protein n=1 Tax=Goodea atripinnis TaxID=208336 RepID=A0ABV0MGQ5_9TELE